jgi:hypothetical protein
MSEQTETKGQELERVVSAVPVPRQLQELGVKIGRDETSGMTVVMIPPQVRQAMNVIHPVSSIAQADPNWSPAISVVQLDKDLHTYPVSGKNGLNKQALETLAKAAGVLYTRTARVPNTELGPGELWAYRATVGFRRSDGTIDEVTRERGFVEAAERTDIEAAVSKGNKFGEAGSPQWKAEVEKRWLAELRFGRAKTESKAINRALRAGLQVPTSLDAKDLAKPFLVIGYNFTPDYDDVETKRILVAAGLNAQAAIYGEPKHAELPAATATEATSPDGGEAEREAPSTDAREGSVEPEAVAEQAEEATPQEESPEAASEAPRADEPPLEPESEFSPPKAAIEQAGKARIPGKGMTIAEAAAKGDAGLKWLAWALRHYDPGDVRDKIEFYVRASLPDVWAEYETERKGGGNDGDS